MQSTQVLVVLRSRDQITLKGTYSSGVKVLLNLNGEKDWDEDSTETQEYMASNLDEEEEWDEESTKNDNTTATILYTQRVGGWYKIKSLL